MVSPFTGNKFTVYLQLHYLPSKKILTFYRQNSLPLIFFFTNYRRKNYRMFSAIAIKNTAQYDFTAYRQKVLPATYFFLFTGIFNMPTSYQ